MSIAEAAVEPRNEYVDFWNTILVPKFVRWRHIIVDGLTLHSAKIFPSLEVHEGDKVVDAGCGFGDTAIQLARLVGPTGSVLAVDCCDGFLAYGRQDAKAAGISNVTFLEADVQAYPFKPVHDFCFSRFGTQFFESPVAGLRNMRATLKPGGVMTMVVWRGIKDNPWLGLGKETVLKFLPPPGENALSCGPGPFSMADTGVVTKQLEIAGYKDIQFEQVDAELFVGNDVDDAVAFQLAIGPAGEVYREAGELAEQRHGEIHRNCHHLAMGEIHHPHDAEDHRQAERCAARVDQPQRQQLDREQQHRRREEQYQRPAARHAHDVRFQARDRWPLREPRSPRRQRAPTPLFEEQQHRGQRRERTEDELRSQDDASRDQRSGQRRAGANGEWGEHETPLLAPVFVVERAAQPRQPARDALAYSLCQTKRSGAGRLTGMQWPPASKAAARGSRSR